MTITIYELLKLIKENKAPKEIEYDGYLLSWDNDDKDYYCEEYGNLLEYLFGEYPTTRVLDITVKTIEQKKIPERIVVCVDSEGRYFLDNHCHKIYITCDETNFIVEEFNSLLDYLKSKGE